MWFLYSASLTPFSVYFALTQNMVTCACVKFYIIKDIVRLYTVCESGTVTTHTCLHKAIQMLHVNIIIIVQLVVVLLVLSWENSWLRSYNLSLEGVIQSADMMPALMGSSITSRNTDQNCDHVIANN